MKYIKELDSIRAIAVILVVISHWISYPIPIINKIIHHCGQIGVDIFFVLSGFLISWILFDNRKKILEEKAESKNVLKNFYIRRTLRIFPIYYLVILILFIFQGVFFSNVASAYPYLLTYTSNFYFFRLHSWVGSGAASPMWSLAVEEQFYLVWPSLMLFINRKYLVPAIVVFIATGIITQLLFMNNEMGHVLTFTCFDAFGMGALLAWQLVFNPQGLPVFYRRVRVLAGIAALFFVFAYVQTRWPVMPLFRTVVSVLALFVTTYIIYKRTSGKLVMGFVWNSRPLHFIGKISYGIYLYHALIPSLTTFFLEKYLHRTVINILPHKLGYILMLGINSALLLFIAWISWRIIEKPILGLKKYFEYSDTREKVRPATIV